MDFTEKRLAASILALASLRAEDHAAEAATASKVLGELHVRAGLDAELAYADAVADVAKAIGGGTEPWLAFTSLGPGHPPPAVELLRPPPDEKDAGWWAAFKAWTGPGQMVARLLDGEVPDNELKQLSKIVTVGIAETAVAGLEGAAAAAGAVFSFGKWALVFGGAAGGYYYWRKSKGKR